MLEQTGIHWVILISVFILTAIGVLVILRKNTLNHWHER